MITDLIDLPDMLKQVITGDEPLVYRYKIETKAQPSL